MAYLFNRYGKQPKNRVEERVSLTVKSVHHRQSRSISLTKLTKAMFMKERIMRPAVMSVFTKSIKI